MGAANQTTEDGGQRTGRVTPAQLKARCDMAIELHDVIEKHRNDPAASTHVLSAAVFWNETLLAGMSVSCDLALPPVESHVRTGFLTREGRLIEGKPIEQGTARSTEGAS